jgi:protein-disulfide isomerase
MICSAQGVLAQKPDQKNDELKALRQEIELLKEEQKAMRRDLQEIKTLLQTNRGNASPLPQSINLVGGHALGSPTARVVLINFSDYQCPFCGQFVRETKPRIEKDYVNTGKLRYVFFNLPLEKKHPFAFRAAEAAECAAEQDQFWGMHDRLYNSQDALDPEIMPFQARALNLDAGKFAVCFNSEKYASLIRKDMALAASIGIEGTPTFLVGVISQQNQQGSEIKVLGLIDGAQPYETFRAAIEAALSSLGKTEGR